LDLEVFSIDTVIDKKQSLPRESNLLAGDPPTPGLRKRAAFAQLGDLI